MSSKLASVQLTQEEAELILDCLLDRWHMYGKSEIADMVERIEYLFPKLRR